jgi:hypothetical protein
MKRSLLPVLAGLAFVALNANVANAQATRTWVSGVGDDANPCSRTAPCKTFAGAISKTATGGYIDCLDPGGFGSVTIIKAITIQCEEEIGHVLATGVQGIIINVAAGTNVTLRGLTIEGGGSGIHGINVVTGGNVHLQEVVITGFTNNGILFAPTSGNAQLHVVDTYITDSATSGGTFAAINFAPAGGNVNAELNRVSLENNFAGLIANGGGGIVNVTLRDTIVSGSGSNGIQATSSSSVASVMVDRTSVSSNAGAGVNANGTQATVRIGNSTITNNVTGVSATSGGTLRTYKNNQINGNLSDGTPIINQDGLN